MAVTQFKFPPLFRKPKNVEIPKRLGVRAVDIEFSNNFLLTRQDILNSVQKLCGTSFSQFPLLCVILGPTSL